MLAAEAGVSAATISEHLRKLLDGGLVMVTARGRYRYYRLAGPQVSDLLEAMARVAPTRPATSLREGTRANALRRARSCYNHLGGRLAVALTSAFLGKGFLAGHDGSVDLNQVDGPRPTGGVLDPAAYPLTGRRSGRPARPRRVASREPGRPLLRGLDRAAPSHGWRGGRHPAGAVPHAGLGPAPAATIAPRGPQPRLA
jgi:Bacterial regulatory protein, arsR family